MTARTDLKSRSWTKDGYFVSTDSSLIPLDQLNTALGSDRMPWAKSMPADVLRETVENSLIFGLYQQASEGPSSPKFIGSARCVTDFSTMIYLTDVWVATDQSGQGLGKWLISCVQSVIDDMPHSRRSMLLTSDRRRSVPFYRQLLGMELFTSVEGQETGLATMQRNGPALKDDSWDQAGVDNGL